MHATGLLPRPRPQHEREQRLHSHNTKKVGSSDVTPDPEFFLVPDSFEQSFLQFEQYLRDATDSLLQPFEFLLKGSSWGIENLSPRRSLQSPFSKPIEDLKVWLEDIWQQVYSYFCYSKDWRKQNIVSPV